MKLVALALTALLATSAITPVHAAGSFGVERHTQAFLNALEKSGGRPLETLSPQDARNVLRGAQEGYESRYKPAAVSDKAITVNGQTVNLKIVRPVDSKGKPVKGDLPVFVFVHGGGWVLGDFPTHERLIRDLVAASGSVAVYVDYTPSPEARFPVAIEQIYAATDWVSKNGREIGVDGTRLAIVGNSVGGNMAAVVALMAKDRNGPKIQHQVLLWPVTNAQFETASYEDYQQGHFLTRPMMKWFWDAYTTSAEARQTPYASPLMATPEQLSGLPSTLIITAEKDVLRDEGEAYGRRLDAAGVNVVVTRYNGMIHDFGLLNALSDLPATQAMIGEAGQSLIRNVK